MALRAESELNMKSNWWNKNWFWVAILCVGFGVLIILFPISNTNTPPPPQETVNPFPHLYVEMANLPAPKVVFLQPDKYGKRVAVVEDYLDSPNVHIFFGVSLPQGVDSDEDLRSFFESEKEVGGIQGMLKGMRYSRSFRFVDWGRDGFVHDCAQDWFFFWQAEEKMKEGHDSLFVQASELDASELDTLNAKYLAILREIVKTSKASRADDGVEESWPTLERLSAAHDAIDDL